ncbi:uracil-DNA glycosylase [Sporosarcina ureilytica]|uniref:Uracil-DNA glycosylase n=1 Tax=Sporosarcina ureilytica TaxID=298596 RepID=A0A1D8JJQ2_9BACL|nr:uracil-DNA glycosylase [Sporosarcina ureilytica]AOV08923.1 uracil-DNA glycosylase [Sporosarcina ureilytica]
MNSFCPVAWPEDPTPENMKNCEECGLYKQGTRMVWGEGNPNAPIMIVLDNPGARENREGQPYVCGTRETLQRAIHEVGLYPDDVYATYILKRRPIRAYDKEQTRRICMQTHLDGQLQKQIPSFVLCLGNVAVQHFFQNPDVDVKSLRGEFHHVNGFLTAVAYHPLAVRRRPNLYRLFIEDLQLIASEITKK